MSCRRPVSPVVYITKSRRKVHIMTNGTRPWMGPFPKSIFGTVSVSQRCGTALSYRWTKISSDPVEIVSPVISADDGYVPTIGKFWAALSENFEFREDASCGFHIHI
ncbi:hypothetical protein HRR80_008979 [Exophiala dermatitidis]|uniref:Uncharacterized protein n=1 Tax=Exophiala dermatitidis TaxID=5970 RepID=A0AAN6IPY4_EXODE|nr:hypothetical protein HRR80_008979 [Exophiala dermatitidis]